MAAKKLTKSRVSIRVDAIILAAGKKIERLAERYRAEVLIPLCREHHLTYVAGMGRTVFYKEDGTSIGDVDDAAQENAHCLIPVFEALSIDGIGQNDCFGYYVRDVSSADW